MVTAATMAGPTILLVDDEADILPEYKDFLEFEGYDALTCPDPELAVEIVKEQLSLKLVITDLRMAKLDGIGLIRRLQAETPKERKLAFMILTGDATSRLNPELVDIPVLIKPADTDALIAEIRGALARAA